MYRRILVALVAAIFVVALTVATTGASTSPAQAAVPTPLAGSHHDAPPCATVHAYNALLRRTVRYSVGGHGGDYHAYKIRKGNVTQLATMRACWKPIYHEAYRIERRAWKTRMAEWHFHARIDAITRCGEWVVCGVVENESATSGYYRAYNGGGCGGTHCYGAYQIAGSWWSNQCAHLAAHVWEAWAQHECAYIVLRDQGLSAWAGDSPYL